MAEIDIYRKKAIWLFKSIIRVCDKCKKKYIRDNINEQVKCKCGAILTWNKIVRPWDENDKKLAKHIMNDPDKIRLNRVINFLIKWRKMNNAEKEKYGKRL